MDDRPEERLPEAPAPEPEPEPEPDQGPEQAASPGENATPPTTAPPPASPVADEFAEKPAEVSLKWPLLVLLVPIGVLALGSILLPELVWEDFVYKYYWGPIVGDEGFTAVNTVSWAILMGALLFLLARIVQKIDQPMGFAVIAAVVPYIMGGSMTRVFEDTGYFVEPLRYFFITPIIYVVIVAVAVFWIVVGHVLKKRADEVGLDGSLKALAAFFAAIWFLYSVWGYFWPGEHVSDHGSPWVLLLAFVVPLVYFWKYTKQTGRFSQVGVMATFGTAFLLYATYLVIKWHLGGQWDPVATEKGDLSGKGVDMHPWVYVAMFAFPAVFTGLVYWVAGAKAQIEAYAVYLHPTNLLLIFSQMMDATMTSLGIDFYRYQEKHVLPGFLIEWMRDNGPWIFGQYPASTVMLTLKFAVALLVVWAIDIYAKEDMKKYPDIVQLAKLAIIMVGLAPGTRDAVRVAMDV